MSLAVRCALAVVAVLTAAWFALGGIQARNVSRAQSILSGSQGLSPAQASRVSSLLRTAGTLNPDSTVQILMGELQLAQGNRAEAERTVKRVAQQEPQNILPQAFLARLGYRPALARIAQLEPPVR